MSKQFTTIDGERWEISAKGVERDGLTYCHLASTTRGKMQRNGFYPAQIMDWVDLSQVESAAHA